MRHKCWKCEKVLSNRHNLSRHKKSCLKKKDVPNMLSYIDNIINQCQPRSSIKVPSCDSPPPNYPLSSSSPPPEKPTEKASVKPPPKPVPEKSPPKPVPPKETAPKKTTPPPVLFSVLPKPPDHLKVPDKPPTVK